MDKFKKAIEQLNKPVEEANGRAARKKAEEEKAAAKAVRQDRKKTVKPEPPVEEKTDKVKPEAGFAGPEPVSDALVNTEPIKETAETESADDAKTSINGGTTVKPTDESKTAAEAQSGTSGKEMSEYEKELERQYYSVRPEKKSDLKKKEKENKQKRKKEKSAEKKSRKSKKSKDELDKKAAKTEKTFDVKPGKARSFKRFTVIALLFIVLAGCIYNCYLNNQLRPVFYQVQSSKVVDNVRVVAISDLHLKEFGENNERLVEKIKSYHPDIIAILGDMNIDKNPDYSVVLNLCARLNEVAPLYYALGNHEFEVMLFEDSQIYYDLKSAGIKVLNNEMETVEVGLSEIDVIGLTQKPNRFKTDAKKFFDKAMEDGDKFKLVLTHYPENFQGVLEEYPIDLAICGHAHGGQVRLPIIGGLYSSDQGIFPKLCDGYHEIENSKVIISKGLGRSGIVPRINNAPEITIIDINWY